ncbi:MAG: FAD-dependent oxidoreductase [Sphingorhabdus sp.]
MSDNVNNVEVAIIGGGIGGLTTAVALNQQGIDAHVYEQAPAYGEVGGHLTMDEAAMSVLDRWGLEQPFRELSCALDGIEVRSLGTGEVIVHMPLPDLANMGVADENRAGSRVARAFLRTDYLKMLTSNLPEDKVHVGQKLIELSGDSDGATAKFESGAEVRADIILASDGVRSLARAMFDNSEAVRVPHTVLRTLCSVDILPDDFPNDRMRFWDGWEFGDKAKGVGVHAMIVPVREGKFVSIDLQFFAGDQLEDCDPQSIPVDRVMSRYPETMTPIIKKMVDARLEPIAAYPLFDRPVANKWVDNRIAILGDAAHSMRPNLGQGACQSVHDAGELANQFAEHGLTTEALLAYEAIRKPYTQSVVEAAKNVVVDPKAWKSDKKPD